MYFDFSIKEREFFMNSYVFKLIQMFSSNNVIKSSVDAK